jgi:hypothetical protein
MLPTFIIQQIRQREEKLRQERENSRPRVQLPIEQRPAPIDDMSGEDDPDRGVVIVDLMG